MAQHDYVIANQGFPAFRSDLNDALAAIVSNNSGATEPTTMFAHQLWVDTAANPSVLKIRNADNDAWITIGTINQTGDTFTLTSAVSATTLNTSGQVVFNDSGADVDFRVESDNNPNMLFVDAGNDFVSVGDTPGGTKYGELLIQQTADNSSSGLAILGTGSATSARIYTVGDVFTIGRGTTPAINIDASSNIIINENGNDQDFRIETDNTSAAFFAQGSSGFIGMGTDVPSAKLTIVGNGGGSGVYMRITDTTTSTALAGIILERSHASLGDWRMQVDGGVLYFGYATDGATFTDFFSLNAIDGIIDSQPSYDNPQAGSTLTVTSGGLIGRTSSSIKYKKDIETLDADLVSNAIANLRPVWYRTKDAKGDDKETWSHIGLIAEEVHEVEPRLVRYRTEKVEFVDVEEEVTKTREVSPAVTDEDGNVVQEAVTEEYTETVTRRETQKTPLETPEPEDVDYGRLAVLCLAKIQELEARIAALEGN